MSTRVTGLAILLFATTAACVEGTENLAQRLAELDTPVPADAGVPYDGVLLIRTPEHQEPCTATKIGKYRLLTSVQCVRMIAPQPNGPLQVTNAENGSFEAGSTYGVASVWEHPSWLGSPELGYRGYDIAVIDVHDELGLPGTILPVRATALADGLPVEMLGYACPTESTPGDPGIDPSPGKWRAASLTSNSSARYVEYGRGQVTSEAAERAHVYNVLPSGSPLARYCAQDSGAPLLYLKPDTSYEVVAVHSQRDPSANFLLQARVAKVWRFIADPFIDSIAHLKTGSLFDAFHGQCVAVLNNSQVNDTVLAEYHCDAGIASQRWQLIAGQSNTFQLRNLNSSNKCMGVAGGSTAELAQVKQYFCDASVGPGSSQGWTFQQVGTALRLVNAKSGKCLTRDDSLGSTGAPMVQRNCTGGARVGFHFAP